ncbi:MAG: PaaI family thioesterase [Cytophagaceae bacterium]|nr:PaaI family thioesterase [Cytophagaceae bacterium]
MNPVNPALAYFKSRLGQPMSQASHSPLDRWLNGTLTGAEEDSLTVDYQVHEEFCNPGGILHGGTAAAMMDDVMGMTVFSLGLEAFYSSVNLSVDFLWSAKPGETITAKSTIVRQGRKIVNAACEIRNAEGVLIAKATSNLVATTRSLPSRE